MATIVQEFAPTQTIMQSIERHSAWLGKISGLKAEKMLRGIKRPFLYLLRAGEWEEQGEKSYYISFILPTFAIKHQPFIISLAPEGWYFEYSAKGGPFNEASIDDVVHLFMNCRKEESLPLTRFNTNDSGES